MAERDSETSGPASQESGTTTTGKKVKRHMQEQHLGDLQSLLHTQQQVPDEGDPALQLVQDTWGFFGASLVNVTGEPVMLHCEELLGLAAFVERHRTWIEEHAHDNTALYDHEASGLLYAWLESRSDPSKKVTLLLTTENRHAWYGTQIHLRANEWQAPTTHDRQEYLRSEWREYRERTPHPLDACREAQGE